MVAGGASVSERPPVSVANQDLDPGWGHGELSAISMSSRLFNLKPTMEEVLTFPAWFFAVSYQPIASATPPRAAQTTPCSPNCGAFRDLIRCRFFGSDSSGLGSQEKTGWHRQLVVHRKASEGFSRPRAEYNCPKWSSDQANSRPRCRSKKSAPRFRGALTARVLGLELFSYALVRFTKRLRSSSFGLACRAGC